MKYIMLILLIAIYTFTSIGVAQRIGIGINNPHPSAKLEIYSTKRGLLIPRLSTAQRNNITNPAHGLIIMNITTFCIETYDTSIATWIPISCPTLCPPCDSCPLPYLSISTNDTSICPGDTVTIYSSLSKRGGLFFDVPNGWRLIIPGDTATFIAGNPGTVSVNLCNECGCVMDGLTFVRGIEPNTVYINAIDSVCLGDTIMAYATGGNTYNWYLPIGWTILRQTDTLVTIASDTGVYYIGAEACNGCGCSPKDSFKIVVLDTALGTVSITGPTFVCAGDTAVYRVSDTFAIVANWQYPSTWQVISRGKDSIVLTPDTSDGYLIAQICNSTRCKCFNDTLFIVADSCYVFCVAIGGPNNEEAWDVLQTYDKGYLVVGWTNSFGSGNNDIYVVKLNASGNVQWTRTIGGTGDDKAFSVVQSEDSSFVLVGWTNSFGLGNYDVYVVKLDKTGSIQWARAIGGSNDDVGSTITYCKDKGFIIVGRSSSFSGGSNYDVYVIKLDSLGNIQWTKTIGGVDSEFGSSIIQTHDKGFLVTGITGSFSGMYVIKLDSSGNVQWTKAIEGVRWSWGYSVTQTSNKEYVIAGYTFLTTNAGHYDVYIVKLDSLGNIKWTRTIGGLGSDRAISVSSTNDGGFCVAGWTASFGIGFYDVYIIKFDANDNIEWIKTIGGNGIDLAFEIIQTGDGGYAIAGSTDSFGAGGFDIYVIKLDKHGNLNSCPGGCEINTGGTVQDITPTVSSGGTIGTGGTTQITTPSISTGGTLIDICP